MLDLAAVGGLAGGIGTLTGGLGGVWGARSATRRHLRQCEDRLVDLETTVGVLLALLPGGDLAEKFHLYRRDKDREVAEVIERVRVRWRRRNNLVRG